MNPITISLLPEDKWQEARIIRFRYSYLSHPCTATIVYCFPMEVYGPKHNQELIDSCISSCLKSCFGDVTVWKRDIVFDGIKDDLKKIYAGGRPSVDFVIRMIPSIPPEQFPAYVGKTIYGYDYHMHIYLDYLGEIDQYSRNLLVTTPFPIEKKDTIAWGTDRLESL